MDGLCTYLGNYHLAWSVPLMDPTYFSPSVFIHCFMMFAPFALNIDRDSAFLPQVQPSRRPCVRLLMAVATRAYSCF